VTTCVDIGVYDLELTPETATNELGTDNEHTVTAALEGPSGAVGGYLVSFAVMLAVVAALSLSLTVLAGALT